MNESEVHDAVEAMAYAYKAIDSVVETVAMLGEAVARLESLPDFKERMEQNEGFRKMHDRVSSIGIMLSPLFLDNWKIITSHRDDLVLMAAGEPEMAFRVIAAGLKGVNGSILGHGAETVTVDSWLGETARQLAVKESETSEPA